MINQDVHERVIRGRLKEYGCEVELGTELMDLEQDDEGVNVKVRLLQEEGVAPHEETIRASYVVGADGAKGECLWPEFSLIGFAKLQTLNRLS